MTSATEPSATASSAPHPANPQPGSQRLDQKTIEADIRRLNECKQKLNAVRKASPGLYPDLVANAQNALHALYNQTTALSNLTLAQAHDITLHPDFLDRHPATIINVNNAAAVSDLVDALAALQTSSTEPDLFLDTEQDPFDHNSWLQIYVSSNNVVYLVDILGLGHTAFTTEGSSAVTLKSILESPAIIKCFYDIRGDSYALFREFDIHMAGLDDIALWTSAAYGGKMDYAISLLRCVEQYCTHWFTTVQREDWVRIKKAGSDMWKATAAKAAEMSEDELGRWTPPINERPLAEEWKTYCVGDVTVMPVIRKHMVAKVEGSGKGVAWKSSIADLTRKRTVGSQVPGFSLTKEEQTAGPVEWRQGKGPHLS